MKKILTTFGGCSYSLKMSQNRLVEQAKHHFNGCASFDENSPYIIQLFREHKDICQYSRGVGFWFWKPFIILKTLESVNTGDYVFYMDVGTDIQQDLSILYKLCTENNGFLIFENRSGNPQGKIWTNNLWTKRDCFKIMSCDTPEYHNGNQSDGAYQLYQKNDITLKFLKEYCEYSMDRRIITDEPNTLGENLPQFIDHRHDQSILSLLVIKHKIKTFPPPTEVGDTTRPSNCPYGRLFLHHRGAIFGRV